MPTQPPRPSLPNPDQSPFVSPWPTGRPWPRPGIPAHRPTPLDDRPPVLAARADPRLPGIISRYADRFHPAMQGGHWIASPLGAWLLLAVAAPAALPGSALQEKISDALGLPIPEAVRLAGELVGSPHDAIHAETAAWAHLAASTPAVIGWAGALPSGTTFDTRIPTQAEANAWASRATDGQIQQFPVSTKNALVVLASALATEVSWREPLSTSPVSALGDGAPLGRRVRRVLQAAPESRPSVVRTEVAGDVALVAHRATTGLLVATVAAADPARPAADVLAAAHQLAIAEVLGPGPQRLDPFDLPLGEGPVVGVVESEREIWGGRRSVVRAHLPAWRAESEHDLMDAPGIAAGSTAVMDLLPPGPMKADAKQVAVASFDRRGFSAAAVSAIGVRATGAPMSTHGRFREVTLRFGHPHAVVAVALDDEGGPWHGVPVFSAWVGQATEVPED